MSVPGSGQLGEHDRLLTARIHTVVGLTDDTVMVKVVSPDAVPRFLAREVDAGEPGRKPPFDYRVLGGTVARKQDLSRLRTPEDFRQAFRLDYPGSPFPPGRPVPLVEFLAGPVDRYRVPFGAPTAPGVPLAEVRTAARAMTASALAAGVDPNAVRTEVAPWPHSGTGLTPAGPLALPVWTVRPVLVPFGAVLTGSDGHRIAEYAGATPGWRRFQ